MQHLEKGMQCLEAKNARLQATVVQQNSRIETLLQGSPLEQAASQERGEEIRAHDHEAVRKLLLSRMGDLKQELESEKYILRESIVLKEKYEKLYLEEVKKRRWLQNELERAEENQGKAKRKLCGKLVLSPSISEGLDVSAEQYLVELGHSGNTLSLSSSLGGSFPSSPTGAESLGNNICTHYAAQSESDRKKEKEELSCPLQVHLDRELEINTEVAEESESSESFSSIKQIIREYGERMSLHELKKEIKDGYSEMANEAAKMHTKLDKLSCQLKEEPKAGMMGGETEKRTSK
ncbi:ankyrin repeat domain-containing protein 26-like [Heliangelus exortis]|uniref:ankyrin repeat domain-containing protein 26-like n=1 Tax=Heliangelus exortis TaxID=472823 RepID=UPI003A95178B